VLDVRQGEDVWHLICFAFFSSGFGSNVSHTFHVHGYNVRITGRGSFGKPISRDEIVSLDRDGKIQRNAKNPVRKDTFVVPNKGYIILRLHTDNLGERSEYSYRPNGRRHRARREEGITIRFSGYWLWEARSTGTYPQSFGPAMQFLMKVGLDRNLPLVPIDFPSCGSNKGMDLIFETS